MRIFLVFELQKKSNEVDFFLQHDLLKLLELKEKKHESY
jgi:hypothetical protein